MSTIFCAFCKNKWLCVQVAREGTKKTVFTNYMELCKAMNRQPEHVQLFLLAELGTSGSLDGQSRLIVKGRFQPKAFAGVLRRYVNECVTEILVCSDLASLCWPSTACNVPVFMLQPICAPALLCAMLAEIVLSFWDSCSVSLIHS